MLFKNIYSYFASSDLKIPKKKIDMAQKKFTTDKETIEKFNALTDAFAQIGEVSSGRGNQSEAFAHIVNRMYEDVILKKEETANKKRNAEINMQRAEEAEARVDSTKERIKKLCKINREADAKHTFYITPNFIKKQLNLGHARVAKKALQDKSIAKLVEETNKKVTGLDADSKEAKNFNLRFRSNFYEKNDNGALEFIASKL